MVATKRARTKRNFRSKKPPVVFALVQNILTEMALYPLIFATPKVTLAVLLAQLSKTIVSYNKHIHGGQLESDTFEIDYEALLQMLFDQADYVDDIADGRKSVILQSGFEAVVDDRTTHKNDESYTQGISGQVKAVLKARNGATGYVWQYCVYPTTGDPVWILADVTKYAKFDYTGLTPGLKYMFRYSPVIANTMSPFSNPFVMIVT